MRRLLRKDYCFTLGCLIQGGARLLIFRFFSDSPGPYKTPRLLIFLFEEASLTLPQCYVENKKC